MSSIFFLFAAPPPFWFLVVRSSPHGNTLASFCELNFASQQNFLTRCVTLYTESSSRSHLFTAVTAQQFAATVKVQLLRVIRPGSLGRWPSGGRRCSLPRLGSFSWAAGSSSPFLLPAPTRATSSPGNRQQTMVSYPTNPLQHALLRQGRVA